VGIYASPDAAEYVRVYAGFARVYAGCVCWVCLLAFLGCILGLLRSGVYVVGVYMGGKAVGCVQGGKRGCMLEACLWFFF